MCSTLMVAWTLCHPHSLSCMSMEKMADPPPSWRLPSLQVLLILLCFTVGRDTWRIKRLNNNRIQRRNSRHFTISSLCHVSNTYVQVARAQLCANHVQHIERLSHATCRVTWYEGTDQRLSVTGFKSHLL